MNFSNHSQREVNQAAALYQMYESLPLGAAQLFDQMIANKIAIQKQLIEKLGIAELAK